MRQRTAASLLYQSQYAESAFRNLLNLIFSENCWSNTCFLQKHKLYLTIKVMVVFKVIWRILLVIFEIA